MITFLKMRKTCKKSKSTFEFTKKLNTLLELCL